MAKQIPTKRLQAAVTAERKRLYDILDKDPAAAIEAARRLRPRDDLNAVNIERIRPMVFIEAGGKLNDSAIVTEGVDIFRNPSLVKVPD